MLVSNRRKLLLCIDESSDIFEKLQMNIPLSICQEVIAVIVMNQGQPSNNHTADCEIYLKPFTPNINRTCDKNSIDFLRQEAIDEVIIDMPGQNIPFINAFVQQLEVMGIRVTVTLNTYGIKGHIQGLNHCDSYASLTFTARSFTSLELFLKRSIDIIGGLLGTLAACIVGIFLIPAIKIESPGPAIFKQLRIGTNGRRFYMYKFRSMYIDAEERLGELEAQNEMQSNLIFKIKNDPRITKVGKFIRKTSLDEFPQFLNVLKGDMSLVGTRPPTEKEFLQYEDRHKRRLSLKPGITGMWQVSGRSEIQDFEDILQLDLAYIDNWSVGLDLKILFKTVLVVLTGKGAE